MMWFAPLKVAAKPPLLFSYLLLRATAVLREPCTKQQSLFNVRKATILDVAAIQSCNIATLPENYATHFYVQHLKTWPQLAFVAEATSIPKDGGGLLGEEELKPKKEIVGYVLGRMDQHPPRFPSDLRNSRSGHITSIAVLPSWRRKGLAQELMRNVHLQMATSHAAERASLHVRVSNTGALRLYSDPPLSYSIEKTIKGYYADGEDAYLMRAPLSHLATPSDYAAEATKAAQDQSLATADSPEVAVAASHAQSTVSQSSSTWADTKVPPALPKPLPRSWVPPGVTSVYQGGDLQSGYLRADGR